MCVFMYGLVLCMDVSGRVIVYMCMYVRTRDALSVLEGEAAARLDVLERGPEPLQPLPPLPLHLHVRQQRAEGVLCLGCIYMYNLIELSRFRFKAIDLTAWIKPSRSTGTYPARPSSPRRPGL